MTIDYVEEHALPAPQPPPWNVRRIASLRLQRGWTQEELAEHSGLSVRTIRNLELGRVRNPRRSSVDLLASALGVSARPRPPALAPDPARWRGPQPPDAAAVGGEALLDPFAHTVRSTRLTTFLGPGGVGKTRLALEVAARTGRFFRDGVAVVELGAVPAEDRGTDRAAEVLHRVRRRLGRAETATDADLETLLVLDNAEHVPAGAMAAVRELLAAHPGVHILITARRRLTERLGANREIRPLPVEAASGDELRDTPAVEFFLRHAADRARAAVDLDRELPLVAELCRRLGGLPRNIEFAVECLRAVPIRLMLAHGPAPEMLWSNDQALLPHQRSVAASIQWSLDLLTEQHRGLLERIAALPADGFALDEISSGFEGPDRGTPNPLTLISDLLDSSLLLPDPTSPYRYRLAHFVAEVVQGERMA
jgi:transcriptional regulator with XRE-family HTH domain